GRRAPLRDPGEAVTRLESASRARGPRRAPHAPPALGHGPATPGRLVSGRLRQGPPDSGRRRLAPWAAVAESPRPARRPGSRRSGQGWTTTAAARRALAARRTRAAPRRRRAAVPRASSRSRAGPAARRG